MRKDKLYKIQSLLLSWSKETENMMKIAQADNLLRDSKQSQTLKSYYEVLRDITQYANDLFVSKSSFSALLILRKLHQTSNQFSDKKGEKGYPKVIHALNPYEIIFAHQYLYYTREIFDNLLEAVDEFKEEKLGNLFGFFPSFLKQESIVKHGNENCRKLEKSLPQFLISKEADLKTIESPAFVVMVDEKHTLTSPVDVCLVNLSANSHIYRIQLNVTTTELELLSNPLIQRTETNKLIYNNLIYKICASVNYVFPSHSKMIYTLQ